MNKVLVEYDVVDGEIRETHRWIAPATMTLGDLIEHVDSSCSIDRDSVRIYSVGDWL